MMRGNMQVQTPAPAGPALKARPAAPDDNSNTNDNTECRDTKATAIRRTGRVRPRALPATLMFLWPNAMTITVHPASCTSAGPRFPQAKNQYSSGPRSLHFTSYPPCFVPDASTVLTNSGSRMRLPHTRCNCGSHHSLPESLATFNVTRSNLGGVPVSQSWDVFHDSPSVSPYARAPCR